jgi:glycerophosphoryl diester phosphodiesterase
MAELQARPQGVLEQMEGLTHPAPSVEELLRTHSQAGDADRRVAARYAPILRLDQHEPFSPLIVGYSVLREGGRSPSFPREISFTAGAGRRIEMVVEYSFWWDWNISQLCDLQHLWLYLDGHGRIARAELGCEEEVTPLAFGELASDARPELFVEPGTHRMAASETEIQRRRDQLHYGCQRGAGRDGVQLPSALNGASGIKTPPADRLAHTYLERRAFLPSFLFTSALEVKEKILLPWQALAAWIPLRARWWIDHLDATIPPQLRRYLRIAHRGASAHAPENTLLAFAKAAELGADMVEMDVHVSLDGAPVVIHDADLSVVTRCRGNVQWFTAAELREIETESGEHIPTLEEAVDCCVRHDLGMYFEIKNGFAIPEIARLIREQNLYRRAIVSSFRPDWLAEIKTLDPKIVTSVLFAAVKIDAVALAKAIGADYVHPAWELRAIEPHKLLGPDRVAEIHFGGLGVISWHEERREEIAALRKLGIEGICSNAPELLLDG